MSGGLDWLPWKPIVPDPTRFAYRDTQSAEVRPGPAFHAVAELDNFPCCIVFVIRLTSVRVWHKAVFKMCATNVVTFHFILRVEKSTSTSFKYSKRILYTVTRFHVTDNDIERDKYLDLAGELKVLCNMKLTVISIVIGALRTTPKGRVGNRRSYRDHPKRALLRSVRILRGVLETWDNLLSPKLQ